MRPCATNQKETEREKQSSPEDLLPCQVWGTPPTCEEAGLSVSR